MQHAHNERPILRRKHMQIAQKQPHKRPRILRHRRRLHVSRLLAICVHRRPSSTPANLRPVSRINTVSRLVSVIVRSRSPYGFAACTISVSSPSAPSAKMRTPASTAPTLVTPGSRCRSRPSTPAISLRTPQIQLVDLLRANRSLQRRRRILHQNLSMVDDGNRSHSSSASSM